MGAVITVAVVAAAFAAGWRGRRHGVALVALAGVAFVAIGSATSLFSDGDSNLWFMWALGIVPVTMIAFAGALVRAARS